MITPDIPKILLNLLVYGLTPFLILFGAFWYGQRQANRANELEKLKAEKDLQDKVNKAENKNQELEAKRHDDVEKLRDPANDIDDLIELWRSGPWGPKSSSDEADKKTD